MISRRNWLVASCELLATSPVLSAAQKAIEDKPSLDAPYDVVVVGSGMAGHAAAINAVDKGAKRVLMLEKGPILGGHSVYSSGSIAVMSPKRQVPQGIVDSVDLWVQDALKASPDCNVDMVRFLAEGSEAAVDWLEAAGVELSSVMFLAVGGIRARCLGPRPLSNARSYIEVLHAKSREKGVITQLNSGVSALEPVRWPQAHWRIHFSSAGTSRAPILAREVVLATGGFAANVDMRMRYDARLTASMRTTANPRGLYWDGAMGDGIAMAEALGAATIDMDKFLLLAYWGGRLLDYAGAEIYVNSEGRRFVNEEASTGELAQAILAQPEHSMWVITDSRSTKGASIGAKLLAGTVKRANTIEVMAREMQVNPALLKDTLAVYNANIRKGSDPIWGRRTFTQVIETPPYYWGREELSVHMTLGGLVSNRRAQVLDQTGSAIEHLWAAGEVVGGIFGRDRPGGMSLTQALVTGLKAGAESAASL